MGSSGATTDKDSNIKSFTAQKEDEIPSCNYMSINDVDMAMPGG